MMNKPSEDSLKAELREQARGFDPRPPTGLRRRIFSALAEVDKQAVARPRNAWQGWAAASVLVVMLGGLGVAGWMRSRPAQGPLVKGPVTAPAVLGRTSVAIADPVTLAHRYVDGPLEAEVESLLTGLAQTRDTVARVLPAPARRTAAATRGT
jgi:hypothetical protein